MFQVSGINKFRIMVGEGELLCVHWNHRCLPRASGEDLEDSLFVCLFVYESDDIQFLKRAIRALSISLEKWENIDCFWRNSPSRIRPRMFELWKLSAYNRMTSSWMGQRS
jgi:hypothetical protein